MISYKHAEFASINLDNKLKIYKGYLGIEIFPKNDDGYILIVRWEDDPDLIYNTKNIPDKIFGISIGIIYGDFILDPKKISQSFKAVRQHCILP